MSRWMKVVFLTVIAAVAQAMRTAFQHTPVQVVGGDEQLLRELLSRVATPMYPGMSSTQPARLMVGALPSDMPFTLPLPNGTQILGGIANFGPTSGGQIYLNVPASPSDIRQFFHEALELSGGWRAAKGHPAAAGFFAPATETVVYCSPDSDTLLNIIMLDSDAETTPINIQWQDAYPGACDDDARTRMGMNPIIPALAQPRGAQVRGGSSGGDGRSSHMSATLFTDMTVEALLTHYGNQLTAAGWQQTGASITDISATSTWNTSADGKSWLGVLLVVDAGDDQRTAFFQATRQRL